MSEVRVIQIREDLKRDKALSEATARLRQAQAEYQSELQKAEKNAPRQ